MFNRVQLRFDASIRKAVEQTKAVKEREKVVSFKSKAGAWGKDWETVDKMIKRGTNRDGTPWTKGELSFLQDKKAMLESKIRHAETL